MTDGTSNPEYHRHLAERYREARAQADEILSELETLGWRGEYYAPLGPWKPLRQDTRPTEFRFIRSVGCGYSEPESNWRDPDSGAHRTAKCEGGALISRGNGLDSVTDGTIFMTRRPCPRCLENLL